MNRWIPWILSFLYAATLTALPLNIFKDRENYINYIINANEVLAYTLERGSLTLISNEPLFNLLCIGLNETVEIETGLSIIIFMGAFLVAFQTLRVNPKKIYLLMLLLVTPQILKNHIVHLRQGLAIGFFLVGWRYTRPLQKWPVLLISPLIHSSFFIVLMQLIMSEFFQRYRISRGIVILIYIVIGLLVGIGLNALASQFGARQAEIDFSDANSSSGLGFIFWFLILVVMLSETREFFQENIFEIGAVIFYLSTYFITPFSARIFESALMVVLLSSLKITGFSRHLFIGLILTYASVQWIMIFSGLSNPFFVSDF
jgi:hypothetical protein